MRITVQEGTACQHVLRIGELSLEDLHEGDGGTTPDEEGWLLSEDGRVCLLQGRKDLWWQLGSVETFTCT